ncbi:MAG TPA: ABC transporter ATP-binding protein [Opitutales bacterium]|nr:ABC transporter ATP-binding protein [Opitutales bacterium]
MPRLFRMVWETNRRLTLAIMALRVVRSVIPLGILWIGKLIIDAVVLGVRIHTAGGTPDWSQLWRLVAAEFLLAILNDAVTRANTLSESLLGDRFSNVVSARLMEHAATLDLKQFEDSEFYDQLDRARRQATSSVGVLAIVLGAVQNFFTLILLTGALVLYVPWLLIPLAIAVLPSFIGEAHFATKSYSLLYRWTAARRQLDYLRNVGTSNQAVKEVKLFTLSDWLVGRFVALADSFEEANARLAIHQSRVGWLLAVLSTTGYYSAYVCIIVLTVQGYHSPMGVFTIGVFAFLAASFRQSRDRIQGILMSVSQLYGQALYLNDLFTFFDIRPSIFSPPNARPVARPFTQGFEFRDVSYRYPGSEVWAVRHVSFTLTPGQRLALVGENGSGKTTLVKLMTRLYDPSEGVILLDGVDLREYDLASLHRAIGVIFQDFMRYDLVLRENIGVGELEALENQERIEQAAARSLASQVAGRLKGGYEQMLGRRFENGTELSGGEWQKVALSRAYLRSAELLILDEPTAALDARAEFQLFQRFTELTRGKMAILISHRFSTVRMADRILVLDRGVVIEEGSHEELVAKGGRYAELFELQASAYR